MARLNSKSISVKTYEGGVAKQINPEQQLRRTVMACMLWENTFYENGISVVDRINALMDAVSLDKIRDIAIEAREKMKLRHIPLLLARLLTKRGYPVKDLLSRIIQRPDELTEFLAIYWKDGKESLSAQVKKGLALAFTKFNEYQLAKYNRNNAIKLRDVLFLCHAKPKDKEQESLWKRLIDGTLLIPDTWETNLSAGEDKKLTWERLINENKLGGLALLRNLRNMQQVNVDSGVIKTAIKNIKAEKILPFRFISSAKFAPSYEPELETAMYKCLSEAVRIKGKTILLVDVSGSMDDVISQKSEVTRLETACGLAILAREICEDVKIFSFSHNLVEIPARRGFALRDAITHSQSHGGTYLGGAVEALNKNFDYDRLIVITDEQTADRVPDPKTKGYVINIATNKNGVGYYKWLHIDGWSESVIDYISELEKSLDPQT